MIVFLDCKIIIFNSNGNDFCPLATYLYKYLTLIVLKVTTQHPYRKLLVNKA